MQLTDGRIYAIKKHFTLGEHIAAYRNRALAEKLGYRGDKKAARADHCNYMDLLTSQGLIPVSLKGMAFRLGIRHPQADDHPLHKGVIRQMPDDTAEELVLMSPEEIHREYAMELRAHRAEHVTAAFAKANLEFTQKIDPYFSAFKEAYGLYTAELEFRNQGSTPRELMVEAEGQDKKQACFYYDLHQHVYVTRPSKNLSCRLA